MLAEERYAAIISILQKQTSATVLELTQALSISESTIRRDLVALDQQGRLKKVHGGATLLHTAYGRYETEVSKRCEEHVEEKKRIARYAAALIQAHDFVYIDAGSTTLYLVEQIREAKATYVTNGLEHARRLAAKGFHTFLLAGELKSRTEAIIGSGAVASLQTYNFTLAFLGTNGITVDNGFTTPDANEAYVKMEAMKHAQKCYVLADSSKFHTCTSITTADISDATIITGKGVEKEYLKEADIIEVEE